VDEALRLFEALGEAANAAGVRTALNSLTGAA
jgi:hypothetical protein